MHPGMMVAVGDDTEHLLKLVDAVRRHDAGILVQEVREPAQKAQDKSTQPGAAAIESPDAG